MPVSVPVAAIGDFLTTDPASEGPLPAAARQPARFQGSGSRASAPRTPIPAAYPGEQDSAASARSRAQATSELNPTQEAPLKIAGASPGIGNGARPLPAAEAELAAGTAPEESIGAVPWGCSAGVAVSEADGAPDGAADSALGAASSPAEDPWAPYWLPEAEMASRGAVMDIVTVRVCPWTQFFHEP